jgi:CRISPR-associated endonuclease/helicase Cas3
VNLFEIEEKYFSHPNYPYIKHIRNIANSFEDANHKITAMYHDLGKLTKAFQTYINPEHPNKKKTTHALIGALFFLSQQVYRLDKNSLPVFLSIIKHHGNLEDVNTLAYDLSDEEDLLNEYPKLIDKIYEVKSITGIDGNLDLKDFCDFFESDNFVKNRNLSGIDSYYNIKENFSKLIFTDKYEAIFKQSYHCIEPINAKRYLNKLINHLSEKVNDLSEVRNSARVDILQNFNKNTNKSIFIIEAPTGIGKTFTALHLALEIISKKNKKRLITALPMTSIIDQTFEEYLKIFDENVLLKFHHLTFSKSYKMNHTQEKENEQEYFKQKDSFLSKSWADDKVIITTFNQLLNLLYSNKNLDLIKFWTLRDSVIVMDEIQAVPRVLLQDFAKTINYLVEYLNIDFILMSATVPDIKQFLEPKITSELLDHKYFSLEFNNRYVLKFNNKIKTEEALLNSIIQQHEKSNSVLTVVNSKKLALCIYEKLKTHYPEKEDIFLLSSNFIPVHRENIIARVSESLKNKDIPILISTQVIEAGVDLDFDFGFREFSPFYSIIQTAGRINRENRNAIKSSATLVVFPEIGFSPYHQNDLLKDEVVELLSEEIREKHLLPLLKKYFSIAIKRTPKEMILFEKMENLEYQEVIRILNENFMKKIPYTVSLFIEIEKGLYGQFHSKLEKYYEELQSKTLSLEKKMNIKIQIKDVYKEVAQYVIDVPKNIVTHLDSFYRDSEMKICSNNIVEEYYDISTGFKLDKQLPQKTKTGFY